MADMPLSYNFKVFLLLFRALLPRTWNRLYFHKKARSPHANQAQPRKHGLPTNGVESLSVKTLMFHMEGALLKSSSVFPYFMLVAFEAGGPLRALVLLLLSPIVSLAGEELCMKLMVFVCFVGLRKRSFSVGRNVLPKFFLEDAGNECFDVMVRCGRRVGVSDMPRVMVEGFLRDYLKVEHVIGRELKVVCGRFVGLMEERKSIKASLSEILVEEKMDSCDIIGLGCLDHPLDQQLFSHCEEVYFISEDEKRNWETLPREKYPKPLIFHDGRLAFRPTPLASLFMFMWIPVGFVLFMVRSLVGLLLPFSLSIPAFTYLGLSGTRLNSCPDPVDAKGIQGVLYVANHRTLFDPIYISMAVGKPVSAVTYSLNRITELFAPIKTVRLTRNREEDYKMMEKQLKKGDLVVCPEGTTCREPYLLRFSPLFAELTNEIVPIAIDYKVSMFYGTTATGSKFLDPVFVFMNPYTHCYLRVLDQLPKSLTCQDGSRSKFIVANHVQAQIARALNFQCTNLTRKDKYMALAGNEGTP